MTLDLLLDLSATFAGLFILGSLLCLPLYHWKVRRFLASSLWIKIVWWLPIYLVFLALCYGAVWVAVPLVILLAAQAIREYRHQELHTPLARLYLAFFIAAALSIVVIVTALPPTAAIRLLVIICFCSVLSDVAAFFLGSYASWHKLPSWLNPRKSWEGVAGQIIGAFVGALIVQLFLRIPAPWLLVLAVGCASAFGDLFNSAVKRQLNIKDWGNTIPGHGGVLDRMSSLSTAFLVTSLLLLLGV